ncbi:hypothetical protein A3D80_03935 [Candidatus Roizmanbacteria bacterium RIFCSPHIGHO2_02_FULL_40_13b]|uniref:Metallo-beta-lactamase domain-containing protein n=1 Tax=Candidatus Roizmanbacteria bacterium RIFCSPHIGHO2_01_FULL_39_24 TaxID=1802032 RepID=A0A1F7GKA5_9BACT|nr:MAG: hypothetical protein A2799_03655 [Candidatus Roizmanbacteria bacterium RIFCSPHIGHO2_01_FULL_39_24]OGK27944.1 MAG: hypothetical protein A3D80_03935 [Candidatus Roizmanbacteria bacterium RIFCSPHIGHO2_02_FULL_40_13b]OGK49380.1 MAG: hypothetical protein A3A56_04295 [Candidatus Roizmanbacteria bacterium RIFCSPLOWO2_01_FULL_40_32]OGK56373.1 MAG: hypothetical protein A3H83_02600 [Candidatus Roizmanbacteria bacterium RIFCSPLOWO2_02_FULL_39_8]
MQIRRYSLGELQTNCYLLIEDKECLIIDPADSVEFISEIILREALTPVGILATHGHFDHIMAAGELSLSFNLPLMMHKDDLFLVKRMGETAKHFLGFTPPIVPPENISFLNPGVLHVTCFELRVIPTPGHTPGSCSFYFPEENAVFTGDTLFKDGIGAYDHSYSDKDFLFQSLQTLFKLPQDTIVYPGHGSETMIGEERKIKLTTQKRLL